MTPHGPVLLTFRDPPAPLWAMLILGLALTLGGGLVGLLVVVDPPRHVAVADMIGVAFLLGACCLGGPIATVWGIYALVVRAEWHLTATHLYRTRGAREVRTMELRALPQPTMMNIVRYGVLIAVRVMFGRPGLFVGAPTVMAPTADDARRIVETWRAAQGPGSAPRISS